MRGGRGAGAALALLVTTGPALVALPDAGGAPPGVTVSVTGEGVATYPAYDAALARFGILTAPATDGRVEVTVTADDPGTEVTVNGVEVDLAQPHPVTGLVTGDEVNVQATGAAASSNQSWIYLPAGFPRLLATGTEPGNGPVFLGLTSSASDSGWETVVDTHGVPLHVRAATEPHDFRAHDHGPAATVFEPVTEGPDDTVHGYRVREYDRQLRLTGVQRLRPVEALGLSADDTDFHDVDYLPDGRLVLLGHQRTVTDGIPWLDAVIQVVGADGEPDLTWTSRGEVDPAEAYALGARGEDYAHVTSVEMQPDGDLVAALRNTGQVLRIATLPHDGLAPGDVVWRLGGERNDFTVVDDPGGGFCAPYDARLGPDGRLMLVDAGSRAVDTCPTTAGARVVEYALDTEAMTATLVWSFEPEGRDTLSAGNAQRLPDGSVLAGWSSSEGAEAAPAPIASRVTRAGEEVWTLRADGWSSYRATSAPAPDAVAPRIRVAFPRPGARYLEGTRIDPDFSCHDRGGSNLGDCAVTSITGGVPGSPGRHVISLRADDGAGNEATRRVAYHVAPLRQPDLQVRAGGGWRGAGRWPERGVRHVADNVARPGQRVSHPVRVVNAGLEGEAFRLQARRGGEGWSVRYLRGGRDLTRALVAGTLTPRLTPGGSWGFRVVVRRTSRVADGAERTTWVRARSTQDRSRTDGVAVESRAR